METLKIFAWACLDLSVKVLPYYALGVFLAGFLDVYARGGVLRKKMLSGGWITVVLAALLGAVVPVCSCGVVPVVTGLVAGGVPIAPAMAFLVAAPIMNPATFTMTCGAMGSEIAAARLACALVLAVLVGVLVLRLERGGWIRPDRDIRPVDRICPCSWNPGTAPGGKLFLLAWLRGGEILMAFSRYVAIGVILGGIISVLINRDWVTQYLTGAAGIPLAALVGVPLYVCTCSEIPVALPLLELGMSKSALVTFLLAGPGISVFSLILVASLLRRRLLILYASVFLLGSMALGWISGLVLGG
jgi:uncharacterized membrane protein YraQ (UPF0718 family)